MSLLTTIIYISVFLCSVTNGARILGIFLTPSYSHQIMFQPVWKELSLRGHQVTVYTPSPLNDPSLTNLTEYDLGFSFDQLQAIESQGYDFAKLFEAYLNTSEAQLNHHYLRDLIEKADNDTYDLLLVEYIWQTYYAFKEIYNVSMVGMVSLPLTGGHLRAIGMDRHPAIEPDFVLGIETPKTFTERLKSYVFYWLYRVGGHLITTSAFDKQITKHFGKQTKTSAQMAQEVSLVLANCNFANQKPKLTTPKFVPISAIHVKPLQPLPKDLSDILDSTPSDAIYFSLGTNVDPSEVASERLHKFFNVLGKLPYTILFKWNIEDVPEDLPANFIVRKWFPQQDLLGHPKVKLFINQGGMQSVDEAILRKVPMLMIPFYADQKANTERCVHLGIADDLDFESFTEDEFESKVLGLLKNQSYRDNIEKQFNIISDQPMSSLDTAVYWIEYVLRHKGAPHLSYEGVHLPFYQYYHLDVYAFFAALAYVLVLISRKIFSFIVKRLKNLVGCRTEKTKTL